MDNVYIKSTGFTKTQVNDNVSATNWNAIYDGNSANLSMNINNNSSNEHIKVRMNNEDLMKLFNVPTIQGPIDQRLRETFLRKPMVYALCNNNNNNNNNSLAQRQYFDDDTVKDTVENTVNNTVNDAVEDTVKVSGADTLLTPDKDEELNMKSTESFAPKEENLYNKQLANQSTLPLKSEIISHMIKPSPQISSSQISSSQISSPQISSSQISSPQISSSQISSPQISSTQISSPQILSSQTSSPQTLKEISTRYSSKTRSLKRSVPTLTSSKLISPDNSRDSLEPVTKQHFRTSLSLKGGKKVKKTKRGNKKGKKTKRATRISTFLRRLKFV